jgi:murein L,D-transpeptidase YcbB/YkuD
MLARLVCSSPRLEDDRSPLLERPGLTRTTCAAAACALIACCGGDEQTARQTGPDAGARREPGAPVLAVPEGSPLGQLALALHRASAGDAWRSEIESVLSEWRGARQPMTDLIRETYRRRDYRPVFLDGLWPAETAAVLIKAVREVPSHGLPGSPYRPGVVIPLHEVLVFDPDQAAGTLTAPAGDLDRLAELEWQLPRTIYKSPRASEKVPEVAVRPLGKLPDVPRPEPDVRCLLESVDAALSGGRTIDAEVVSRCRVDAMALDRALAAARAAVEQRAAQRASLALLDALLVQAFYQWVIDFTIDSRVHPFKSQGAVNRTRLPAEHSAELLEVMSSFDGAGSLERLLRSMVPRDPAYDHTRRALDRYAKLMDGAKVGELRQRGRIARGEQGDAVEALQRRLAAEGYYSGPVHGDFDDATHEAVVRYQRAHQLADGGVVGPETVESLNVPLEWRVKQLMTALGRWRESPISRSKVPDFYFRVNLPAFELEIVERGTTVGRHKVIIGDRQVFDDPLREGLRWHLRRTKLFDTRVNEVVLNPNWIVPEAIRVEEIEPKIRATPTYLADNNFKQVDGMLVQGPAPTNPLGVVKFSLESTDSIYLHDTDKRFLFKELVRDFSHGCVRVDESVALAKLVLARQGVAPESIDRRIEEGMTLPIELEDPIPIFIEYVTVGFDDDGGPVFYADLYDYDVAYWKKRTPITREFP